MLRFTWPGAGVHGTLPIPQKLREGWECRGGITGCASVSHARSKAESPPEQCEHQARAFSDPHPSDTSSVTAQCL